MDVVHRTNHLVCFCRCTDVHVVKSLHVMFFSQKTYVVDVLVVVFNHPWSSNRPEKGNLPRGGGGKDPPRCFGGDRSIA